MFVHWKGTSRATSRGPKSILIGLVHTPQRGDLVATRHEIYGFEIGRVIGLPGDRVVMDTESILVNQQLLGEPYISNTARFLDEWQGVLGEGEYFVIWASTLGDNLWRGSAVSERKIVGRL